MDEKILEKMPKWFLLLKEWFKEDERKEEAKGDVHVS
jgi:hypothetical protein